MKRLAFRSTFAVLCAALSFACSEDTAPPQLPGPEPAREWQWVNPAAAGNSLWSVWGFSESEVYAVGNGGAIVRLDGARWRSVASPTERDLRSLWGTDADNIYAVGTDGTVLNYDGSNWSTTTAGSNHLRSVHGSSASNVFAVGFFGEIQHFDGTSWTAQTSGVSTELVDVFALSVDEAFAVGKAGTVLFYDGSSWSTVDVGLTSDFGAVWAFALDDVWIAGAGGVLLHYDGVSWTNTWAGGELFWDLFGAAPDELYAVSNNGAVLSYDGGSWSTLRAADFKSLLGVWASGGKVFASGGNSAIVNYDAGSWQALPGARTEIVSDIWLASEDIGYAVGEGGLVMRVERGEATILDSGTSEFLNRVWGSDVNNVFAVGMNGTFLHFDGTAWSPMATDGFRRARLCRARPRCGRCLRGGCRQCRLALRRKLVVDHSQPGWRRAAGAVGERGKRHFCRAGAQGAFIHYDGSQWSTVNVGGVGYWYTHMYGDDANNIWAVGELLVAGLLHLRRVTAAASRFSMTVVVAGAAQHADTRPVVRVTVAGQRGHGCRDGRRLMTFDGSEWTSTWLPGVVTSSSLFGNDSAGRSAYTVGENGVILWLGPTQ